MKFDRYSYYLGMTFAFVECVGNDAKEVALTQPFTLEEFDALKKINEKIISENQLYLYWDKIDDITVGVIYKYEESIIQYKKLRQHYDVIHDFDQFKVLLGYNVVSKLNGYKVIQTKVSSCEEWLFNK